MLLFRQLRALVTMMVLANHTPVAHVDQLGISLFIGRFTRVAAAQQFDPTRAAVVLSTQQKVSHLHGRPDEQSSARFASGNVSIALLGAGEGFGVIAPVAMAPVIRTANAAINPTARSR